MLTIIRGANSMETAHTVTDYPYGRTLRTSCRWWLEKAVKGSQKGRTRLAQQTLNPKTKQWNKPNTSIYWDYMVLYSDAKGHVHSHGVHLLSGPGNSDFIEFFKSGLYFQLTEEEQNDFYAVLQEVKANYNTYSWQEFQTLLEVAREIPDRDAIVAKCPDLVSYDSFLNGAIAIALAEKQHDKMVKL